MALHNFIRQSGLMDDLLKRCDEDENFDPNDEETSGTSLRHNSVPGDEDAEMNAFREWIATGLMSRA
jgi:hypothetical protein